MFVCLLHPQAFSNNFLGSREFQLAADALDAYKSGDQEALAGILKDQMWQFLPAEIVRMARGCKPQRCLDSGVCEPTIDPTGDTAGPPSYAGDPLATASCSKEKGYIKENSANTSFPVHEDMCGSAKDSFHPGEGTNANVSIDELLC